MCFLLQAATAQSKFEGKNFHFPPRVNLDVMSLESKSTAPSILGVLKMMQMADKVCPFQ